MLSRLIGRESKAARGRVASVTFYQHTRRFWFLFVTETARFRAALRERGRGLGHAPFHDRELNLAADLLDDVHGLAGNLLDLGEVAVGEQGGLDHPGATAGDDGGGAQVLLDVGSVHAAGGHKAMADKRSSEGLDGVEAAILSRGEEFGDLEAQMKRQ